MTTRLQQQQAALALAQQQAQQAEAAINLSNLEGKNRKSYTLAFKRQVINFYHANAGNISLAAKMFAVDRKMVRSWVEQEDFLRQSDDGFQTEPLSLPSTVRTIQSTKSAAASIPAPSTGNGIQRKRLDRNFTSGSSARYPELEKSLTDWRLLQLSRGQEITSKSLKAQALRLFHELYPHSPDQDFKASTGWLQRFVTRMENSGGLGTGVPTAQLPSSVIDQAINRRYAMDSAASSSSKSTHTYSNSGSRSEMQRSLNQHPALQALSQPPQSRKSSAGDARDRAAPYLVPIKPKPSPPAISYEMPVVVPKESSTHRRNSDVRVIQDEDPAPPSRYQNNDANTSGVEYVIMTHQERADVDRQTKEANRFFTDCRDFLTFLNRIEI